MAKKKEKAAPKKKTSFLGQLIWLGVLSGILIASGTFLYISKKLMPDTEELENPKYKIASSIIGGDGTEIGRAYSENRVWITYEELNPNIINALVATEDERYFSHSGIDARSFARALVFLGKNGGASTITQQLAKQFFVQRSKSFPKRVWQKLKEWVIAVEFEKRYTKEEIIAMYLNKYEYRYNAIGIGTAAKTYFGKDQKELEPDQAAILIGLLKNPYIYNPKDNPENCARRKAVVLKQMVVNDYLSQEDYEYYSNKEIDMSGFQKEDYSGGLAPYFRSELIKWVKIKLKEDQYKKSDGTAYNIYTDGLKISTTINPKIQQHAEDAMREQMSALQETYFKRWKNKDPWTFEAEDNQKELRASNLASKVRESERFIVLRTKYLREISKKIYDNIPKSRLLDGDIFRLFNAEKDKRYLDGLIRRDMIGSNQKKVYNEILASEYWLELKETWTNLRNDADEIFDIPVKMTVFDYSNGDEKIATMSPLDSIKYYQQMLQLGSVAVDPKNGHVLAWVGGIDHKHFKFDHVTSNRQVGSTFKPFIYATAIIDQALSPCLKVQDNEFCIPAGEPNFRLSESWCPVNSHDGYSGEWMTLRDALRGSVNSISAYLMGQIGNVQRVRSFVEDLGIDGLKIPEGPAIALGSAELSAMDMASAYTTFANNGIHSKPIFVTKIEDKNGRIIYSSIPEQKRAINEGYNYVMVDMLKHVSSNLRLAHYGIKSEVAGKTGTTNSYRDGWFVGFTPEIVISTWVGGDMEWIRFRSLANGQGAVMARPMFVKLLRKIEEDKTLDYNIDARFNIPNEQKVVLNCERYDEMNPTYNNQNNDEVLDDQFEDEFGDEF